MSEDNPQRKPPARKAASKAATQKSTASKPAERKPATRKSTKVAAQKSAAPKTSTQRSSNLKLGDWFEPGTKNIQLIYILYLISFFSLIPALVGIVLAHMNSGKARGWIDTHYVWAIRTFWIGLLYLVIATVLAFVVIGLLLYIVVAIWIIIRCVIGLQAVSRNEPIKNPESWLL
jgi:uncharacterized membrane protein